MKKLTSCILLLLVCLMATVVFAESTTNRTIELTDTEIILFKGDNHNIKATVTAVTEDAPKQTQLVWESADTTIASVAQNGTVNGKAAGETILTCRAKDDDAVFATVKVTVVMPVEKVVPAEKNVTLLLREEGVVIEQQLTVAVEPSDAYCTKLVWKSSNEKVVIVDENGKLTAVGKGTANITVTSAEERKGKEPRRNSISVTVKQGVTAIEQGESDVIIGKGRSLKLTAKVMPETANNKALVWTTSDPAIATVEGGNVTGKGMGECIITATAKDGSGVSVNYNVTVIQQITSLNTKTNSITINKGSTEKVLVNILPENATNKRLAWVSSDPGVATVDENGNITAVYGGKCFITCSALDGSGKSVKISVKVPTIQASPTIEISELKEDYRGISPTRVTVGYYGTGEVKASISSSQFFDVVVGKPSYGSVTLSITPKRKGTATITLQDTKDSSSKAQIKVTIHDTAVPQEIKIGKAYNLNGQTIKVSSISYAPKYNHEYWYNSRRGMRVTLTAYDDTYIIVKARLMNNTGKSLRPQDQITIKAADASGNYEVSNHFPVDYQSTLPAFYVQDGYSIYNGYYEDMVYLISVPNSLKNAPSLRLYFLDDNNDIVGVYYKNN